MSDTAPEAITVTTDLIGARCKHSNGSGTVHGTIRGVFIHRNSAGSPGVGYLIELDDGAVLCRSVGMLEVAMVTEKVSAVVTIAPAPGT